MLRSNRRAALDLLAFHLMNRPVSRIFGGRNLLPGGSITLVARATGVYSGDISGIAAAILSRWPRLLASPPRVIASVGLFPQRASELGGQLLIIEFERPISKPEQEAFTETFDRDLARRHLDYEAQQAGIRAPQLQAVPHGAFAEWMRRRGRLGAQNKVPRVVNDLDLFRDLQDFAGSFSNDATRPESMIYGFDRCDRARSRRYQMAMASRMARTPITRKGEFHVCCCDSPPTRITTRAT
jgi:GH3 auxin-responsive promoter